MPDSLLAPGFWAAVFQIVAIDIVLSGDNAVVIALACRNLAPSQRRLGIVWGVAGAVVLRIALTLVAALLMNLPWLKLVGGALLLWIGVKLLLPEDEEGEEIAPASHLRGAVRTIIVADFVMSLDNVIGVAGAAHGNLSLLVFGLLLSIPLVVWSSQLILHLMERWPAIVTLGGALLGWVAGGMMVTDPALTDALSGLPERLPTLASAAGAMLVVGLGKWFAGRRRERAAIRIE